MQSFSFILFFVLIFLVVYLPGRLLLRLSGYKFASFLVTFSSSLIVGLAAFLFCTYILSWIKIPFVYNIIIPIVLLLEFKHSYTEFKNKIKIRNLFTHEALLIIFGTALMTYTTWNSGVYKNGEMLFYGVNGGDSVYHLALIKSLISNFPPFHPGLAGILLRGYNFFYDFLISNFVQFYYFDPLDLFFRYFSLSICLMLGFSSLSLTKFLKWGKLTTISFIFLMYFVQSFDFFAGHIYRLFNYYYDSAGITQSLGNALDPSIVISASFVFIGFILLFSKSNKWSFLLPVLVIGVIPEIKIYAGIIFYLGLAAVALWDLYRNRSIYYLKIIILSGAISALVYLPINYGAGELIWAPLQMYKNFIDSAWIFNNWHWNVNFPIFVQAKNYIHIAFFYAVAISIFLITSLGIRIITVLDIKRIFSKKFYSHQNIFWSAGIVGCFLIPSLFLQSVSSFQTIQFFWFGYILLLIPTAVVFGEKLERKSKIIIAATFLVLIFLFLPDTIMIIKAYSDIPAHITTDILRQTEVISKIPQADGIIAIDRIKVKGRYIDAYPSPIISALSGHSIYYENELTSFGKIDKIAATRKENVDKIAENMVNCNNPITAEQNIMNIMKKTNNKYLLVLEKNNCTQKFSQLKIVIEGETSVLYKI